jgi:glycerol dehydrogenase
MIRMAIFPGRYVQGAGALARLGPELARFGGKAFLLCAPSVIYRLMPLFDIDVAAHVEVVKEPFRGECSDEEIARVSELVVGSGCDVVAGIGGGKTLDTAKAVAHSLKLPVACAPTIASTDAPCSALSVVYTPDGRFKRYLIHGTNPNLVLVDTSVVAQAPVRFLVSGMGDALATWFEADSCRTKYAANMSGDLGCEAAYTLARLCYDTLLEHGLSAKMSCEAHVVTHALEHVVEANTLLSGLGFESGGLAAAHAIHNGLTVLGGAHGSFHGEKVAIGVLASLFLTDKTSEIVDEVYDFCEEVGLPATLADIGLEGVSDDDLMRVANAATAPGETIHNEPVPVTPEMVFAALKLADAEGRARKR